MSDRYIRISDEDVARAQNAILDVVTKAIEEGQILMATHESVARAALESLRFGSAPEGEPLRAVIERALAVPDNNRYGEASDPGSVLRETREILRAALDSGGSTDG